MENQVPLPVLSAFLAVARCAARSALLLARRRIHLPRAHVGEELHFADGTVSRVYRETVVDGPPPAEPCVLVVGFRLRGVRGERAHALLRLESLLNTPCSPASRGSYRSCGWQTTPAGCTGGSTSGTARRWPRATPGRSGGCSLW